MRNPLDAIRLCKLLHEEGSTVFFFCDAMLDNMGFPHREAMRVLST